MKNKKFFSFGFGRRKCSLAEVILFPGKGIYQINFINHKFYFQNNKDQIMQSFLPLKILNIDKDFNVIIYVNGGGLENQTKAISLSIARDI